MIQARLQISGQINGRENLTGGLNTSIKEIKPELENLTVTPLTEEQKFKSEKYGYDEVIVERVTADIDSSIKPENIKKGETILGIEGGYEGVDTSDATANPNDILVGKTAYVNNEKIEGIIPNNGILNYKPSKESQEIPSGYTDGGTISGIISEELNIIPNVETQIYDGKLFDKVTVLGDDELKSENIKEGINIFNVEGSYKGIDTSDATVNPNQILEGQTAYANGQKIEGTMPNNGSLSFTPSDEQQTIPNGYSEGGKVEAADITKLNEYDVCLTLANSIETTEDYTDTTATAEDIKEGKVAYSNGERIVGTAQINNLTITNGAYLFYNGNRQNMLKEILSLCKKITTTEYMFYTCRALTEKDIEEINKLDTSEVTSMKAMFYACSILKNIVLTNFNTSKVKNMYDMFRNCTKVENIDLSSFNTSNVTEMDNMFNSCAILANLDLSGFDMSEVIRTYHIFYNCKNLTNLKSFKNLGKGYIQKTSNYSYYTLELNECVNLTHESLIDVITNGLYDLNLTYDVAGGGTLYTQKLVLGTTNLAKLTAEEIAIVTAKGWTVS